MNKTMIEQRNKVSEIFSEWEAARGTHKRIRGINTSEHFSEVSYNETSCGWERELKLKLPESGYLEFWVSTSKASFPYSATAEYIATPDGVFRVN